MAGIRRQRRCLEGWCALLAGFAGSGQTLAAFCQREAVSVWRASTAGDRCWSGVGRRSRAGGPRVAACVERVCRIPLIATESSRLYVDLHLDLGGDLILLLVRD